MYIYCESWTFFFRAIRGLGEFEIVSDRFIFSVGEDRQIVTELEDKKMYLAPAFEWLGYELFLKFPKAFQIQPRPLSPEEIMKEEASEQWTSEDEMSSETYELKAEVA